MKGEDLMCDCGAGAIDVDPGLTISEMGTTIWHCVNGHLLINGKKETRHWYWQRSFGVPEDRWMKTR